MDAVVLRVEETTKNMAIIIISDGVILDNSIEFLKKYKNNVHYFQLLNKDKITNYLNLTKQFSELGAGTIVVCSPELARGTDFAFKGKSRVIILTRP
jgi:hypothetical protein